MQHILHNTACCLAGKFGELKTSGAKGKKALANPLELVLPMIPALSGNKREPRAYAEMEKPAQVISGQLFRWVTTEMARKTFEHNPGYQKELLKSPWVKHLKIDKHLSGRPADEQAVRLQRLLFWHDGYLREMIDKGRLDWDNGDYLLSLAVVIAWSYSSGKKVKIGKVGQRKPYLVAYDLILQVLRKHPKHAWAAWVKDRYLLSWGLLTEKQLTVVKQRLAKSPTEAHRLLHACTCVHLGIKYKDSETILHGASTMKKLATKYPMGDAVPTAEAWGQLLSKKPLPVDEGLKKVSPGSFYFRQAEHLRELSGQLVPSTSKTKKS